MESRIRSLGELRSNRDENEVREALDCLERISDLSKDDDNNDNVVNNSNNGKMATATLGGGEEGLD